MALALATASYNYQRLFCRTPDSNATYRTQIRTVSVLGHDASNRLVDLAVRLREVDLLELLRGCTGMLGSFGDDGHTAGGGGLNADGLAVDATGLLPGLAS